MIISVFRAGSWFHLKSQVISHQVSIPACKISDRNCLNSSQRVRQSEAVLEFLISVFNFVPVSLLTEVFMGVLNGGRVSEKTQPLYVRGCVQNEQCAASGMCF